MFVEFTAIAALFQQNEKLTRLLRLTCCELASNLRESIRCLLTANSLDSLVIYDCYCEQNQSLDISGAIKNGQGLKELVLFNTNEAEDSGYRFEERILVSHETIKGILF
jgi:hypothetical protein